MGLAQGLGTGRGGRLLARKKEERQGRRKGDSVEGKAALFPRGTVHSSLQGFVFITSKYFHMLMALHSKPASQPVLLSFHQISSAYSYSLRSLFSCNSSLFVKHAIKLFT